MSVRRREKGRERRGQGEKVGGREGGRKERKGMAAGREGGGDEGSRKTAGQGISLRINGPEIVIDIIPPSDHFPPYLAKNTLWYRPMHHTT